METRWMLADALRIHQRPMQQAGSAYRVFVRDLVVASSIGIYEYERQKPQQVRVNVLVTIEHDAGDNMHAVLNYETIVEGVRAIAAAGHIELVEIFASRVIERCFEDPRAIGVWVSVEKLEPYPEAESVGVVMERHRRIAPPGP